MDGLTPITERLWIGDRGSVHDWVASGAYAERPAAILDLSGQEPPEWSRLRRPDLRYRAIPVVDGAPIAPETLGTALRFIARALGEGRLVIVHCAAGISRSPTIVAAYLRRYAGMEWKEAMDLVRQGRPIVAPHPTLEDSVKAAVR